MAIGEVRLEIVVKEYISKDLEQLLDSVRGKRAALVVDLEHLYELAGLQDGQVLEVEIVRPEEDQ